jgi:CBS domain-containing protein
VKGEEQVKVRELMTKEVITVAPNTTVAEAVHVMRDNKIRYLPITAQERVVGVVTDGDILFRAYLKKMDVEREKIESVMTKRVITIDPEADELEAVKLMGRNKIRRLPVVKNGRLVGILSVTDLESRIG